MRSKYDELSEEDADSYRSKIGESWRRAFFQGKKICENVRHLPINKLPAAKMKILLSLYVVSAGYLYASDAVAVETVELEPAVFTAEKPEPAIFDMPGSVAVYDSDFMGRIYVTSFDELSDFIPGVKVQEESLINPGYVIRGMTTDNNAANVFSRVSVFREGVSISRAQTSTVKLYDLERVEAFKGPQPTLFGRGVHVGALQIIQNKAVNETSGELSYGMGNFDQYSATGYLNTPIVENKVFLRFAGTHSKQRGYIDNYAGSELNGEDVWAGRISLGYEPGPNVRGDLILNYQYDDAPGTSLKSGTFAPPEGSTNPYSSAGLNRGEGLFVERDLWEVTHLFESLLSADWTFNSITGWHEFGAVEEFDSDGTLAYFLEMGEDSEGEQFSQEFRFHYDSGNKLSGFAGGGFFYERSSQTIVLRTDERSAYNFFTGAPLILEDGTPNLVTDIDPFPFNTNYVESFTNSGKILAADLFVESTYEVSEAIKLTAGLRGTYEKIQAAYLIENNPDVFFDGEPGFLLPESNGKIRDTEEFISAVGHIAATYRLRETTNLFATVSRGRRPNTINVDNNGAETLDAETLWNYEIGIKGSSLSAKINYDASLFYYDYRNFQTDVLELVGDEGGTIDIGSRDAGNAHAWGFEGSLQAQPSDSFSYFLNYAFIDARFEGSSPDENGDTLSGNRFRLTPEHSASAGMHAQVESRHGTFYIAPNYTWQSQLFFEDTNLPGIEQGSYGLFNATIGLLAGEKKQWHIYLYGKNLFDKDYLIEAGNIGGIFGIPTFVAGPPLRWGIVASASF